jgi:hypothetical protein
MKIPEQLNMEFTTKNQFLRSMNYQFCNWGQRKPTYDNMHNIVGSPAPLWVNPSKTFYLVFWIINLILAALFVTSFAAVSYMNNNSYPTDSDVPVLNDTIVLYANFSNVKNQLHPNDYNCIKTVNNNIGTFYIVVAGGILFLNAFLNLFLYIKDYASDEEWSRYLFFLFVLSLGMISIDIAEYYFVAKNFTMYNSDENGIFSKEGVTECPTLFNFNVYVNLFIALFISFLSIIQAVQTIKNYKILFYPVNQDLLRARCENPDIVIMSK